MRKGKYKIRTRENELVEIEGMVSRFFGISTGLSVFAVTHLLTGSRFNNVFYTMKQARKFVILLEKSGIRWDTKDVKKLRKYKKKIKMMYEKVKKDK